MVLYLNVRGFSLPNLLNGAETTETHVTSSRTELLWTEQSGKVLTREFLIKTSEESAAKEFLREMEALKREQLPRPEPRALARPRDHDAPVRPVTSFHTDSRYDGDLHRADMAWAVHAAARGLSREQIEHEILNSRDLSKKGPPLRQWA